MARDASGACTVCIPGSSASSKQPEPSVMPMRCPSTWMQSCDIGTWQQGVTTCTLAVTCGTCGDEKRVSGMLSTGLSAVPVTLCAKYEAGQKAASQSPGNIGSNSVTVFPARSRGSVALEVSSRASSAFANSSRETLTKHSSEGTPLLPAPSKKTARASTRRPSAEPGARPCRQLPSTSTLKPGGAVDSCSTSPRTCRSKYCFRLPARSPKAFAFCRSASTRTWTS
mmetsp:Transcript_43268/g.111759  ORF Transcript_43268/g.111759 Transcript_43268/m.111759 type:complete len:226 (+) Transcript_43268:516-1193(+)